MYASESFDLVWSYIIFRHIPSLRVILGYLREIDRVLVQGGRFIVEVGHFVGWQHFLGESNALRFGLKRSSLLGKIGLPGHGYPRRVPLSGSSATTPSRACESRGVPC